MAIVTSRQQAARQREHDHRQGCDGNCCTASDDGGASCTVTPETDRREPRGRIRGMIALSVACIASPCCTPLIMPAALSLLAGTPAALWMSSNLGWVFGALTLLSAVSLYFSFRWLRPRRAS